MDFIEQVKASKAKAKRNRDNWKARALKAEHELASYKDWEIRIMRWHRNLLAMMDNLKIDMSTLKGFVK